MHTTERVAVFMDVENVAPGSGDVAAARLTALDRMCRARGVVAVRRAYADWAKPAFAQHQDGLASHGVDLVQVTRSGSQQKNAADIRIVVDAMESVFLHPEITTYVLVAGDSDYSPLVQRLRAYGKTLIGVGTEASASPRLVAACDEYTFWETLQDSADVETPSDATRKLDLAQAVELLIEILDASADLADAEGWVFIAPLKSRMRARDASFDELEYGADQFSRFLELPEVAARVETRREGLRVDTRLRGARPGRRHVPGQARRRGVLAES